MQDFIKRLDEIYTLLVNMAYEGGAAGQDEVLRKGPMEGRSLIRDQWCHGLAERLERDSNILARHFENMVSYTRSYELEKHEGR